MIKEFVSKDNDSSESIYFKINYDKKEVFLTMRDKQSNDVDYLLNYDKFKVLCNSFKTVMDSLPEK